MGTTDSIRPPATGEVEQIKKPAIDTRDPHSLAGRSCSWFNREC